MKPYLTKLYICICGRLDGVCTVAGGVAISPEAVVTGTSETAQSVVTSRMFMTCSRVHTIVHICTQWQTEPTSAVFVIGTYLLLALRCCGPWQDNGQQEFASPSAPVGSHCPDAVPIDSSVHQVLFKCGPPSFRWTTSSSATTTRGPWHGVIGWSSRWHPDDVTCHPKSSLCCNVL